MIPYGRQSIDQSDIAAVLRVLRSDWLTQGPQIGRFESALARSCGSKFAVAFNSGTAALHGAYFALGLKPGDEFLTTSNTFVATANAGLYLGARPNFVDIDPETGNIDAARILKKITPKTRMIVPVHYSGHPADMEAIHAVARKRGIFVVEDACHALGAEYRDKRGRWIQVGSCAHSDMTVLSFHPVKHITTGEGGAVTTNDARFYERLLLFRSHGITRNISKLTGRRSDRGAPWYYEMQELGFNYRVTDLQAALGASQLVKLKGFVRRRRRIADLYRKAFDGNPYFDLLAEKEGCRSSYHLFSILVKPQFTRLRTDIFNQLRANGLGVQVHYIPVHLQPFYQKLGYRPGLCPNTEDFYDREISLPMFPALTDADVRRVVLRTLKAFKSVC